MDAAIAARLAGRGGIHQQLLEASPATHRRSVLAERLVEVWSWGQIFSPLVQWLAEGSLEDLRAVGSSADLILPDLAKLASIGTTGEWSGNTRRDLLSTVLPTVMLPKPLPIRVPFVRNIGPYTDVSFTDAAIMMPNELFDALYHHYRHFFNSFVANNLVDFWQGVADDDPVGHGHPVFLQGNYRESAVPFMVLGDKVRYTDEGASLHVLAWSPIQGSAGSVWQKLFLLAIFPSASCCKIRTHMVSTMRVFWDYIALGFTALSQGVHPALDPYGLPWPSGSPQAFLAGKLLTADSLAHFGGHLVTWSMQCKSGT